MDFSSAAKAYNSLHYWQLAWECVRRWDEYIGFYSDLCKKSKLVQPYEKGSTFQNQWLRLADSVHAKEYDLIEKRLKEFGVQWPVDPGISALEDKDGHFINSSLWRSDVHPKCSIIRLAEIDQSRLHDELMKTQKWGKHNIAVDIDLRRGKKEAMDFVGDIFKYYQGPRKESSRPLPKKDISIGLIAYDLYKTNKEKAPEETVQFIFGVGPSDKSYESYKTKIYRLLEEKKPNSIIHYIEKKGYLALLAID